MPDPIAVTIPEAVRLSGQSRTTLYEALKNGLPARKAGRRTLIMYDDLKRYISDLPSFSKEL